MGMFETTGRGEAGTARSENALRKLDRMSKTLRHEQPDRVPTGDFFWGAFIRRWREELELPDDANPYLYYDFIVNLVREHGKYPLDLGEYDLDMS